MLVLKPLQSMFAVGEFLLATWSYSGAKPVWIYSNYKFIRELYIPLPMDKEWTETVTRYHGLEEYNLHGVLSLRAL